MPLNPEDLHSLVTTIEVLNTEVAGLRIALVNADKRARWARSVAIVGVVAGIIGGAVGLGGVIVGANAKATAEDLAETRRETQVSACIQANLTTQRTRDALIDGVSVLTQPDPRRGDAEQAAVDRFVVEYTRKVNAALPYRDCSPGGIRSYYSHPPIDPALGTATSSTVVTR